MAVYTALTLIVILITIFILFCKKRYSFWKNNGVKGPTPLPILGNFGYYVLLKMSYNQRFKEIYEKYNDEKLVGLYGGFQPIVLIRDPEFIKHILIKDFNVFQDRGITKRMSRISENLLTAEGEKWRIMRQKLTPVFTPRKLKDMTHIIQQCADRFMKYVDHIVDDNVDHEIQDLTAKYTLESIGSCAFGLDLNTLTDEMNEFSRMAKKVFTPNLYLRIILILENLLPSVRRVMDNNVEVQNFFLDLVRGVIKSRGGKPSNRNDFMDLMIELRGQGKISTTLEDRVAEMEIDDYTIAAQAFIFYAAGFESSSSTMSFLLHELAVNQDVQERVYQDICQAMEKHNGEINYESIKDMKYLEMAFYETLRKYPAASILLRQCNSKYTFPGTNITISKGTRVFISVSGLARDPNYFPNPEKFDPENFLPERMKNIPQCVYLPFGDGPRHCIGSRFAKLQSMIAMASFIKKFKVEPSSKTKRKLEFDIKVVLLKALDGIWMNISRR